MLSKYELERFCFHPCPFSLTSFKSFVYFMSTLIAGWKLTINTSVYFSGVDPSSELKAVLIRALIWVLTLFSIGPDRPFLGFCYYFTFQWAMLINISSLSFFFRISPLSPLCAIYSEAPIPSLLCSRIILHVWLHVQAGYSMKKHMIAKPDTTCYMQQSWWQSSQNKEHVRYKHMNLDRYLSSCWEDIAPSEALFKQSYP